MFRRAEDNQDCSRAINSLLDYVTGEQTFAITAVTAVTAVAP